MTPAELAAALAPLLNEVKWLRVVLMAVHGLDFATASELAQAPGNSPNVRSLTITWGSSHTVNYRAAHNRPAYRPLVLNTGAVTISLWYATLDPQGTPTKTSKVIPLAPGQAHEADGLVEAFVLTVPDFADGSIVSVSR